jgi:hypothetical protein
MQSAKLLDAVTDAKIQFVNARDDGSPLPTIGRRVIVTGPPDVLKLMSTGDAPVLEELVGLLRTPGRAWAAEVVLASLTSNEAEIVNAFAADPDRWRDSLGKNAYERWSRWLTSHAGKLTWNPEAGLFVESGDR